MDNCLINRCRTDKTALQKAYTWTSRNTRRILLAGSAGILLAAILLISHSGLGPVALILLVAPVAYLILAFTLPARFTKLQLRRMEETLQADRVDTTVEFHPEEIVNKREGSDNTTQLRYTAIKTVAAFSGLILLWTQGKQFILLDPARFENGTEADFWKLMNEKCPNAVPKKYRQPMNPSDH